MPAAEERHRLTTYNADSADTMTGAVNKMAARFSGMVNPSISEQKQPTAYVV